MVMKNPVHPGEILREDVLAELGLSVTEAAARLGISRVTLSRVLQRPCRGEREPCVAAGGGGGEHRPGVAGYAG